MSINKKLFELNLKNKNYSYCIESLRNEIINILTLKIKGKNPQFVYTTVKSLKVNSLKYLSEEEQNICIDLYNLSFDDYYSSETELYSMLNL